MEQEAKENNTLKGKKVLIDVDSFFVISKEQVIVSSLDIILGKQSQSGDETPESFYVTCDSLHDSNSAYKIIPRKRINEFCRKLVESEAKLAFYSSQIERSKSSPILNFSHVASMKDFWTDSVKKFCLECTTSTSFDTNKTGYYYIKEREKLSETIKEKELSDFTFLTSSVEACKEAGKAGLRVFYVGSEKEVEIKKAYSSGIGLLRKFFSAFTSSSLPQALNTIVMVINNTHRKISFIGFII